MDNKNWLNYWDKKNIWSESDLWKKNTQIFYQKTTNIFSYNEKHIVLEIGCGNGDFAKKLSSKVKQIYCLDTSEEYVNICKKKFSSLNNVRVLKLSSDYTNLSFIKDIKFSIIIANSVIQYYKSQNEIVDLVKSVKELSVQGSQFLISDIVVSDQKTKSRIKIIYNSLLNGYFFSLMKMAVKLIFDNNYSNTEAKQPILILNLEKLIKELSIHVKNITLVSQNLTVNPERKHLLLTF